VYLQLVDDGQFEGIETVEFALSTPDYSPEVVIGNQNSATVEIFDTAPPISDNLSSSFETGDFLDWSILGNTSIETVSFGVNPTEGNYQAVLTSGAGSVTDTQLENFAGLSTGALDNLLNGKNATEGSIITQTITVNAGDTLQFDWNYFTQEGFNSFYSDSAFISISNTSMEYVEKLADTSSQLTSLSAPSYGMITGYQTFSYQFSQSGTFTLGVGILDAIDTAVDSALVVDNFTITKVVDITPPNGNGLSLSFETGDFLDWSILGNTSIETVSFGVNPTEGNYQAVLTSGAGSVTDTQLENFAGLSTGALDNLLNGKNATEGSIITQTITVNAGDTLQFDWNYFTQEGFNSFYSDSAFISISNTSMKYVEKLADTSSQLTSLSAPSYGMITGYQTFSYQFSQSGTFTLGVGILDAIDTAVDSALVVDNFTIF
jgi:hypothetical protein